MPNYIYILYSEKLDKYYIGSTQDIGKRLERHNPGATASTKAGRPWKIVYEEVYENKQDAIKRENYLKRMKSRIIIENLINKQSEDET